jgi:hypothetical protein
MQVANIVVPLLLVVLMWNSAAAGASYADPRQSDRSKTYAMGRAVISIIIAVVVGMIAWK